jgi:hypothetical protein
MNIKTKLSILIIIVLGSIWIGGVTVSAQSFDTPFVSIEADEVYLSVNGRTTIRWYSNNANFCNASGGANGWSGARNISGNFNTGRLNDTTTFYISCSNNFGFTNDSVTIYVDNGYGEVDIRTNNATGIDYYKATLNGFIDTNDSVNVYVWFEWGTSSGFHTNQTPRNYYGNTSGTNFRYTLDNLSQGTTYYFRTVAQNSRGDIFYGTQRSFKTDGDFYGGYYGYSPYYYNYNFGYNSGYDYFPSFQQPYVVTYAATIPISSYTSAILNGYVDPRGGNVVRWFEWGTLSNNLSNATTRLSHGTISANFNQTISGLQPNTTYYFRAVAQGIGDPIYGNILAFTTKYYPATTPVYIPPQNTPSISVPVIPTITTATVPTITIPVKISPIMETPTSVSSPAPKPTEDTSEETEALQKTAAETSTSLQSTVLFFGEEFFPRTLLGWIFLLLLVALLVFAAQRAYGEFKQTTVETPKDNTHTMSH